MSDNTEVMCLVMTTVAGHEDAVRLSDIVLEQRLAACIHMIEIESCYRWKEKLCREREVQLMMKTTQESYPELEKLVREVHPYDLPEIIMVPVTAGSPPYLAWVRENVKR
ncbi:divalent-cation tolerance protein CutA [Prosthecochloris sp. HL-130-GSB]|jgi:periplasmic divalent cation tolerance protein|uniref:Divalent-cation tolerance protein CutA n=1 Tax=Prosthecochloris aestuarii TaxID=1102 RepID=A0A831SS46_PROAE|nr:divalent-cation tolerance protein CutA [Prosthecochloris sp. HL-130-GSB]ARM30409.1 hypothetical protein B9H02_02530 [Prosthecochloris sp. HL-130-GSB]MBO8092043.1 divalent-cation tolerance protein CutA [Prosthecochloris sp.]HED30350.1 divalent-cation tolerance protein CutA [Prosthecochloris aestuarii]